MSVLNPFVAITAPLPTGTANLDPTGVFTTGVLVSGSNPEDLGKVGWKGNAAEPPSASLSHSWEKYSANVLGQAIKDIVNSGTVVLSASAAAASASLSGVSATLGVTTASLSAVSSSLVAVSASLVSVSGDLVAVSGTLVTVSATLSGVSASVGPWNPALVTPAGAIGATLLAVSQTVAGLGTGSVDFNVRVQGPASGTDTSPLWPGSSSVVVLDGNYHTASGSMSAALDALTVAYYNSNQPAQPVMSGALVQIAKMFLGTTDLSGVSASLATGTHPTSTFNDLREDYYSLSGSIRAYNQWMPTGLISYITGTFAPAADDTYDLGTPSLRWRMVYADPISAPRLQGDPTLSSGSLTLKAMVSGAFTGTAFVLDTSGNLTGSGVSVLSVRNSGSEIWGLLNDGRATITVSTTGDPTDVTLAALTLQNSSDVTPLLYGTDSNGLTNILVDQDGIHSDYSVVVAATAAASGALGTSDGVFDVSTNQVIIDISSGATFALMSPSTWPTNSSPVFLVQSRQHVTGGGDFFQVKNSGTVLFSLTANGSGNFNGDVAVFGGDVILDSNHTLRAQAIQSVLSNAFFSIKSAADPNASLVAALNIDTTSTIANFAIVDFNNFGNQKLKIDPSGALVAGATQTTATLAGATANSASVNATAVVIKSLNNLTGSGAKILSVRNSASEKASIDKDGNGSVAGTFTADSDITTTNGAFNTPAGLINSAVGQLGIASSISGTVGDVAILLEADKFGGGSFANDVYLVQVSSNGATSAIPWGLDRHGAMFTNFDVQSAVSITSSKPAGRTTINSGSTISIFLSGVTANDQVFTQAIALGTGPSYVKTAACTANTITITMDADTTAGNTTIGWEVRRQTV